MSKKIIGKIQDEHYEEAHFMKLNSGKIEAGLVLLFVFCCFLEVLTFPDVWIIIGGVAICGVLYARQQKLRIDLPTCLLALTILLYFGIDTSMGIAAITPYTYIIPIMFITAHYLSSEIKNQENSEQKLIYLILAMAIGITIHGILNSFLFMDKQWLNGCNRIWMDFWSGEYKYAAWQNSYFLPAMAMAFPALTYFRKRKAINGFLILSSVFFLYISLDSESRVTALMLPIVICAQIFIYILFEREKFIGKFSKKQILSAAGVLSVVLIIVAVIFLNSSLGQHFIGIMNRDGGIFNNIRFKFQRHALSQLFLYPFGGRQMDFLGYGHAHNAWIDIADKGGVVPFFAFIIFTFISVFELIKLLRNRDVSTEVKLITAGIYFVFVLFFTIESALESYDNYILPWIFLQGLIHGYVGPLKNKRLKVSEN